MKQRLAELNYEIKDPADRPVSDIPDDATVVVLLAPTILLQGRGSADRYLTRGGRLMIALIQGDESLGLPSGRLFSRWCPVIQPDDAAYYPTRKHASTGGTRSRRSSRPTRRRRRCRVRL
jgi:hypothetical protein